MQSPCKPEYLIVNANSVRIERRRTLCLRSLSSPPRGGAIAPPKSFDNCCEFRCEIPMRRGISSPQAILDDGGPNGSRR